MKSPVFISGNQDKVDYISKSLEMQLEHQKISLDEIQSVDPIVVVEHKVRQAYEIIQKPVLIEDTCLAFTALDGLPGPFIKFFVDAHDGFEMMCRMLDSFDDRSATASTIFCYYDGKKMYHFPSSVDGVIAQHPRGNGGYGWDVIFEPEGYNGLTNAELSLEKYIESHKKIRDIEGLKQFLNQ